MEIPLTELLTLLSAGTAAVIAIINAIKAQGQAQNLATNTDLTAQTHATVSKVQSLVNGQSEALKVALEAAQGRITALEAEQARLKGQP